MVSPDQALIQFQTKLVLVQVYPIFQEYMYQLVLSNFQCLRKFILYKPLPVSELIALALEHPDSHYNSRIHQPKDVMIRYFTKKLLSKSEMLSDYFSIEIKPVRNGVMDQRLNKELNPGEGMLTGEDNPGQGSSVAEPIDPSEADDGHLISLPIIHELIKPYP